MPGSRPERSAAGEPPVRHEPPALLEAGRVGRPHGLDGSFYVQSPRPGLLELGGALCVADGWQTIARRAGTDARPIVRLERSANRDDAVALRGEALLAARESAPQLEENEWWAEDLAGCAVVDGQRAVGVVRRMMALPSCEVLEVARPEGGELLVPLVSDAVRSVDIDARTIDVDLRFLGADEHPPSPESAPPPPRSP